MYAFDKSRFTSFSHKIFSCDSPSGYTHHVIDELVELLTPYNHKLHITNKGNLSVFIQGESQDKVVAMSAHVDTLGLMVRSVKSNGYLAVTNIGGPIIPTLDGEYCRIKTRDNVTYTGTILSTSPSSHVYDDAQKERKIQTIEVRIDEKVSKAQDVYDLGIQNGDYVFIEPKFEITPSGFVKSRFIDDKGSVVALLDVIDTLHKESKNPAYDTYLYFVSHEEVGHGAATISSDIDEFVTIDMGCVGLDLAGNEFAVSIAAKDSGGPYDYGLTSKLIELAKKNNVKYVVDIFPFYGSDVGAAWRAGADVKGALIGPGVHASHGMERTHLDAIFETEKLIYAYLTAK